MVSTFESLPFYRGFSKKFTTDCPCVKKPRIGRVPRNSPEKFHKAADNWFKNRFGIRYRSEGLFITSSKMSASAYAYNQSHDYVMRIIPLSDYKFCWSPNVSDLLFIANEMAESSIDDINARLDSADYRDDAIQDAHKSGCEVMLYCEQYIAIPINLVEAEEEIANGGIILP